MEINLRGKSQKRVEQPKIENKNRTYGCSMCDRTFKIIVPPGVGVGTVADRSLFTMVEIEFTTHSHDYHNDRAELIDPNGQVHINA